MTTDESTMKEIAKVKAIIGNEPEEKSDSKKKPEKESKPKRSSWVRIPASMLFLAFMLAGIACLTIVNDMYIGFNWKHTAMLSVLLVIMVIIAVVVYGLFHDEQITINEMDSNKQLSDILKSSDKHIWDEFQNKYEFMLGKIQEHKAEIAAINTNIELIDDWLAKNTTFESD